MANHKNPEMVARNLAKIQNWSGNDVHDIMDAVVVIRANGEKVDLTQYAKPLPEEFNDFENNADIVAIDVNGVILYADETYGDVSVLREQARRESLGLGPLDRHGEYINKMITDYKMERDEEARQVAIRKRTTSAHLKACEEVLTMLQRVKDSYDASASAVEQNITTA